MAEVQQGFSIRDDQPAESFSRMDGRLRSLLSAYSAAGHSDWQLHARFSTEKYRRNFVVSCDDFELLVGLWRWLTRHCFYVRSLNGVSSCRTDILKGWAVDQLPEVVGVSDG